MAMATSYNCPNYSGVLYTKSNTKTPFLNSIGAPKYTNSVEFVLNQEYTLGDASQPNISEEASTVAPAAEVFTRTQSTNVTQIFQRTIEVTYGKMSNMGTLSGVNIAGQQANPTDELAFQKQMAMLSIANDLEYTALNGTYNKAATGTEANRTRGILEGIVTNAVSETNALSSSTIRTVLAGFFKTMYDNNTDIDGNIVMVNSDIKAAITEAYEGTHYLIHGDYNTAGANVSTLLTDFGTLKIMLSPKIDTKTVLCYRPDVIHLVEQITPNKGNFFYEPLAKTGASEKGMIFGQAGLDYGFEAHHGKLVFA